MERTIFFPMSLAAMMLTGCPVDPATKTPGDSGTPAESGDFDGDGYAADQDCDDRDATVRPGAEETCDGRDENCDGTVDDGLALVSVYSDADGDTYGDDSTESKACTPATGQVAQGGDCDDTDADVHPGAPETDCTSTTDFNCDGSVGYSDADADGYSACQDCDDASAAAHPGGIEICDAADVDEDCDGTADDADSDVTGQTSYYVDGDSDGYGGGAAVASCDAPAGYTATDGDCDDSNTAFHPGAAETDCDDPADYNCDGSTGFTDADADGYAACQECNDVDAAVSPAAEEICNGIDDDCDSVVDPDTATGATEWYADADADAFGDLLNTQTACSAPSGYVADSTDCDDSSNAVNPDAKEVCNFGDDNCDGAVDEGFDTDGDGVADCVDLEVCDGLDNDGDGAIDEDAVDATAFYADADSDGFGDASVVTLACSAPSGSVSDATDCNDADVDINPGAAEVCDGIDNNCDGGIDDAAGAGASDFYADADSDGFGDASVVINACSAPAGYVPDKDDCDDTDAAVNPDATEHCDGVDEDCDGTPDEGAVDGDTWYADADDDGYGDAASAYSGCSQPLGYVSDDTDCDDVHDEISPAASEVCNGADDDCDTTVDEGAVDASAWYADSDSDGYGDAGALTMACTNPTGSVSDDTDCDDTAAAVHPGVAETCNLEDDNCDGVVDEDSAIDAITWYADADADGYGDAAVTSLACDQPTDFVADNTDCDDNNGGYNPAASETCDGGDDNCDGLTDDASAVDATTWYADTDADGFGDLSNSDVDCDAPTGFIADSMDCDDTLAAVNPSATEVCDVADRDENCNSLADDDDSGTSAASMTTWYADGDSDGYGAGSGVSACDQPTSYVASSTDCDDLTTLVHPGAAETCNNLVDDNCDDDDNGCALNGSGVPADADYRAFGAAAYDYLGSVAGGGDLNGDGYDDVIGGAWGYDTSASVTAVGRAYAIRGPISAASVASATTVTGSALNDYAGFDVGMAGDTDGDGNDDFLVGAYGNASTKGMVSLVRGPAASSVTLTGGYTYMAGSASADQFGYSVSGAGDTNNDGYDDVIIGAPGYDGATTNAGGIAIYRGPTSAGAATFASATSILTGTTAQNLAGQHVAGGGDVDGDGSSDILVGVPTVRVGSALTAGSAYLVYGPTTAGTVSLSTSDAIFSGAVATSQVGMSVATAGDTNDDGYDDVLVGADQALVGGTKMGSVYLFNGSASPLSSATVTTAPTATLTGSALDDFFGRTTAHAGDINGDGDGDVIVGATGVDRGSTSGVGAVYLFYGPLSGTIAGSSADYLITATVSADAFGYDVSPAGDTNADGYADFVVGYASADSGTINNPGAVTLFLGSGF